MTTEEKYKLKMELSHLLKRLERDFNEKDKARYEELQAQHLRDPSFFREWMIYDRLQVLMMLRGKEDQSKELYDEAMAYYCSLKYTPENSEFYQDELKAWKKAHDVK